MQLRQCVTEKYFFLKSDFPSRNVTTIYGTKLNASWQSVPFLNLPGIKL